MREFFVHLANTLPTEVIIEEMEKAITAYKTSKKQADLDRLETVSAVLFTKGTLKTKTPEQLIEYMNKAKKGADFLTPKQN